MNNKVIWITGASSGIGKALAIKFANEGWQVAASARRENLLKELNEKYSNIHSFPLDVTDSEKCKTISVEILNKLENIETNTIHSASAITSMIGEAGLQFYKVGRVVTIMNEKKSTITPYTTIYKNLAQGLHSVILLEYNHDENYFLDPKDAISNLLDVEKEQKRNVLNNDTFAIIASRIGFETQKIISGKFSNLLKVDFGEPPHSIIITGKLHFTESDAINVLTECLDKPSDNSTRIKSISVQMIERYVPMVMKALEEIRPLYNDSKEFQEVFENAELYINDAENFLKQGKDENAVLSIGYADGLVDALRMAKGIDPKM